jgi:hypothetical protein
MTAILALAAALLLAACANDATAGGPGSLTARLNGQAVFFTGVSGATK